MFKFTSIFTLLQYQYCNGNCNMINKLYSWTPTDFMERNVWTVYIWRQHAVCDFLFSSSLIPSSRCSTSLYSRPVSVISSHLRRYALHYVHSLCCESDCWLCRACPSVRPSVWNNLPLTGGFFMKFDIWDFSEVLSTSSSFIKIWQE
jgi:hypothetical protein